MSNAMPTNRDLALVKAALEAGWRLGIVGESINFVDQAAIVASVPVEVCPAPEWSKQSTLIDNESLMKLRQRIAELERQLAESGWRP